MLPRLIAITIILMTFLNPAFSAEKPKERTKKLRTTVNVVSVQDSFTIEPLASGVYAAIAKPSGEATTNAMFIIGRDYVVAMGAHMSRPVIADLYKAIAARTKKPVRYFILAHHHVGYTFVDFDFPQGQDVIMSWQTWKNIDSENRRPNYSTIFFDEGMTLKPGGVSVILTNIGKGHTDGDIIAIIPEAEVVFTSDLLYIDNVGFMGNGFMTDWLLALDFIEQIGAKHIIPGTGPVSRPEDVYEFSQFFRDFLTEVLRHIERGDSLEETLQTFELKDYINMDGYTELIQINIQRAYNDLSVNLK